MISKGRSRLSLDGRPLRGALAPPPPDSWFRQLDKHLHKSSDELSRRQASSALGTTLVGLGGPSSPGLFTSYVAVPPLVAIEQLIKSNENVLRNLVQTKNTAIPRLGPHTPARSQRSPPRLLPAPATPLDMAQRAALSTGRARCSALHVPYRVTPRHQVCPPELPMCPPEPPPEPPLSPPELPQDASDCLRIASLIRCARAL